MIFPFLLFSCTVSELKNDFYIGRQLSKSEISNYESFLLSYGENSYQAYSGKTDNGIDVEFMLDEDNRVKFFSIYDDKFRTLEGYRSRQKFGKIKLSDIASKQRSPWGDYTVVIKSGWKFYFPSIYNKSSDLPKDAISNFCYKGDLINNE